MRSSLSTLIFSAVLTVTTSHAQIQRNTDEHILARLSYSNTMMEYSGAQSRRVCFAVYDSGLYRLWRPDPLHINSGDLDPAHVLFEGQLTTEQMLQFRTMMKQLDFRSREGGLVQMGAESFLAELPNNGKTIRFKWVNPDHRHPFPRAVSRMVDWLQDFEPHNSTQLALREMSDTPVCPSANDNPLPLTAGLPPIR